MKGFQMCGRYHVSKTAEEIEKIFGVKVDKTIYRPNYNASPNSSKTNMPLIANNIPDEVQFFRWGLIPSWSKEEKTQYNMFNAKIETIHEKASYKNLVNKSRCIVISDGYYEWMEVGKPTKQPFRICKQDESLFAFAGLWTEWTNPQTKVVIPSFTIILTQAYSTISHIHDRMPIMLNPDIAHGWLMNELEVNQVQGEMIRDNNLKFYPVSKLTGNSPELLKELNP